jgi:hypothetical protein
LITAGIVKKVACQNLGIFGIVNSSLIFACGKKKVPHLTMPHQAGFPNFEATF